jgi:hypothetical protein
MPSAVKKAIAAARSSTTTLTWSNLLIVMSLAWQRPCAAEDGQLHAQPRDGAWRRSFPMWLRSSMVPFAPSSAYSCYRGDRPDESATGRSPHRFLTAEDAATLTRACVQAALGHRMAGMKLAPGRLQSSVLAAPSVVAIALASLFSDWVTETATTLLPGFLTVILAAPPIALGLIEPGHRVNSTSAILAMARPVRPIGWAGRGWRGPLRNLGLERAADNAGAVVAPVLGILFWLPFTTRPPFSWPPYSDYSPQAVISSSAQVARAAGHSSCVSPDIRPPSFASSQQPPCSAAPNLPAVSSPCGRPSRADRVQAIGADA